MEFIQSIIIRLISLAIFGAIAAFASKYLGVEKSAIVTGVIGAGLGWGACWVYYAWFSQPKGLERPGEAGLAHMANRRAALDNSIRVTMPAAEKTDAERKG